MGPLVTGVSKSMEALGTAPLDEQERDGGVMAFSALMRQYGGELDATVLVALWVAGVSMPRVLEYLERRKERMKAEPKVVQGEAKVVSSTPTGVAQSAA